MYNIIRNIFRRVPLSQQSQSQGARQISTVSTAGVVRSPTLSDTPIKSTNFEHRTVEAGATTGIRARLVAWFSFFRPPETEQAKQAKQDARKLKCLIDVTKAANRFNYNRNLGELFQSMERALEANCSVQDVINEVSNPKLLLRKDSLACIRAHPLYSDNIKSVIDMMLTERATSSDQISKPILEKLGESARPMEALADLVTLYGSYDDAINALGQSALDRLQGAFEKAKQKENLSFPDFLQILIHSSNGQASAEQLDTTMRDIWRMRFPASTKLQTKQQLRAKEELYKCFDPIINSLKKGFYYCPLNGHARLQDAIFAAERAGLTIEEIQVEFYQRPLTMSESQALQHNLSHPDINKNFWRSGELCSQLLLDSIETRRECAKKDLDLARRLA